MQQQKVLRILGCLSLIAALAGCAGNMEGSIFLDNNGNQLKDGSETNIAGLQFTVTKDDEEISAGETDSEGRFEIELDGAGTYCVEVTSADLVASDATAASSLIVAPATVASAVPSLVGIGVDADTSTSETNCTNDTDDDADGNADCRDSDCNSVSSCVESDCDDNVDNDDNGLTDCDDTTDCGSNSACEDDSDTGTDDSDDGDSTATVENGRACNESNGFVLELDVPIAVDYDAGLESIEDETYQVSRGESVNVEVVYPQSCSFQILNIPSELELDDDLPGYNSTSNQLDLNEAIEEQGASDIEDSLVINIDPLNTFTFAVTAVQQGIGDDSASFTPKVDCPDDSEVTLAQHTFTIDSDDDFDLTLTWTDMGNGDGTAEANEEIQVTTTITNNSAVAYTADEVTLTYTLPTNASSFFSFDANCDNATSNPATCEFAIPASSSVTVQGTYQLPSTLNATDRTFTTSASLVIEVDGSTATFTGSSAVTAP